MLMEVHFGAISRILDESIQPSLLWRLAHHPDHFARLHLRGRMLFDQAAAQPNAFLELALGCTKGILQSHSKLLVGRRWMKPRRLPVDHQVASPGNSELDSDMISTSDALVPVRSIHQHSTADEARLHPLEL
jgi:hypothetical protein